ncbi:hypothetical protein HK098_005347 [Nowakowskiella sp. JEL0407]|nr:hypothetical protein HK098_005347 [Nowakowskiella sp. JEL0407]
MFFISTSTREIKFTALHISCPLTLHHGTWLNLVIDMGSLISDNFRNQSFKCLDHITLHGSFRLRKIFTLKTRPSGESDFFGFDGYSESITRNVQFPIGVEYLTQVFDMSNMSGISREPFLNHEPPDKPNLRSVQTKVAFGRNLNVPSTKPTSKKLRPVASRSNPTQNVSATTTVESPINNIEPQFSSTSSRSEARSEKLEALNRKRLSQRPTPLPSKHSVLPPIKQNESVTVVEEKVYDPMKYVDARVPADDDFADEPTTSEEQYSARNVLNDYKSGHISSKSSRTTTPASFSKNKGMAETSDAAEHKRTISRASSASVNSNHAVSDINLNGRLNEWSRNEDDSQVFNVNINPNLPKIPMSTSNHRRITVKAALKDSEDLSADKKDEVSTSADDSVAKLQKEIDAFLNQKKKEEEQDEEQRKVGFDQQVSDKSVESTNDFNKVVGVLDSMIHEIRQSNANSNRTTPNIDVNNGEESFTVHISRNSMSKSSTKSLINSVSSSRSKTPNTLQSVSPSHNISSPQNKISEKSKSLKGSQYSTPGSSSTPSPASLKLDSEHTSKKQSFQLDQQQEDKEILAKLASALESLRSMSEHQLEEESEDTQQLTDFQPTFEYSDLISSSPIAKAAEPVDAISKIPEGMQYPQRQTIKQKSDFFIPTNKIAVERDVFDNEIEEPDNETLELEYDEERRCYFDPKTLKYYELTE